MPTFALPHIFTSPHVRGPMRTLYICVINNFAEISLATQPIPLFLLKRQRKSTFMHGLPTLITITTCSGKSGSTCSSKIQTQTHTPNFTTENELLEEILPDISTLSEKKMLDEIMIFLSKAADNCTSQFDVSFFLLMHTVMGFARNPDITQKYTMGSISLNNQQAKQTKLTPKILKVD